MAWFSKPLTETVLLRDFADELRISRVWMRGRLHMASAHDDPNDYLLQLLPGGHVVGKSYIKRWEPLDNPSEGLLALYNEKS